MLKEAEFSTKYNQNASITSSGNCDTSGFSDTLELRVTNGDRYVNFVTNNLKTQSGNDYVADNSTETFTLKEETGAVNTYIGFYIPDSSEDPVDFFYFTFSA